MSISGSFIQLRRDLRAAEAERDILKKKVEIAEINAVKEAIALISPMDSDVRKGVVMSALRALKQEKVDGLDELKKSIKAEAEAELLSRSQDREAERKAEIQKINDLKKNARIKARQAKQAQAKLDEALKNGNEAG